MWGKCKVCQEKDKRISELKDQISHLRTLVYPVNDAITPTTSDDLEIVSSDDLEKFNERTKKELDEITRERDRLLSGQY